MARTFSQLIQNILFQTKVILAVPIFIFLVVPLGCIVFVPFLLFRFFLVNILAPIFRRDLAKVVSLGSSIFAAENIYEPGSYTLVVGLLVEGEPSIEKFREEFTEKVLNKKDSKTGQPCYPEFHQNIRHWLGYPFWKDVKKFEIQEQIRELPENELFVGSNSNKSLNSDLPWNCNTAEDKMQLICNTPWNKDKPLWEMFFIRNFTPLGKFLVDTNSEVLNDKDINSKKKYTLILIRAHHAFCDGFSATMVFSQAMNLTLEDYTDRFNAKAPKQSGVKYFLRLLLFPLVVSYDVVYFLMKTDDGTNNPLKVSEKDLLAQGNILHTFTSEPFHKQSIKNIAKSYKVSFSAVIFDIIASGIQSSLIEKQGNEKDIPEKINVWLPLPVPNHPDKLRNWMSFGLVSLPMRHSSPAQRLKSIHKKLEKLRNSTTVFAIYYLGKLYGLVPRCIGHEVRKIQNSTGFVSSFPGPSKIVSVAGFPVVNVMFSASPVPGRIGVMAGFGTYFNSGRLHFRGFKSIFPEKENIQGIMEASMSELDHLSRNSAV